MPTTRSQTKALTETEKLKAELKIKKRDLKAQKAADFKLRKAQIVIEKEEKAARLEAKKIASENAKLKAELKIKKRDLKAQKAADFKLRKAQIVIEKEAKLARKVAKIS